jgi:hypothetical protein
MSRLITSLKSDLSGTVTELSNLEKSRPTSGLVFEAQTRIDDAARLAKFLFSPAGLNFQAKQVLLNTDANIKNLKKFPIVNALAKATILNGVLIGQAGVSGTGIHLSTDLILNQNYVKNGGEKGKRYGDTRSTDQADTKYVESKGDSLGKVSPSIFVPEKGEVLANGSGSLTMGKEYGNVVVNYSNIESYLDRLKDNFLLRKDVEDLKKTKLSRGINREGIKNDSAFYVTTGSALEINPTFRSDPQENTYLVVKNTTAYYGPGEIRGYTNYDGEKEGRDSVNIIDVSTEELADTYEDIIPFKIVVYEPGQESPLYLYFRAFLDNLSDNYSGGWNSTNYIGRAEPLYNYTSFNRQIRFGFKIATFSKNELYPLYNKLNTLVGTTAPSYSDTFMRGVFTKLTIGDWIRDVPGFFQNIGLQWETSYPWEIGRGKPTQKIKEGEERSTELVLPHILDVSVDFTPIHNFVPQFKQPFISDGIKRVF